MTVTRASTLRDVALAVGAALERHGITAVLTGGACAAIHSGGAYASRDLDFVLTGRTTQPVLDRALEEIGFHRSGERYLHPVTPFWVEFPRGPLAVGNDYKIRPTMLRGKNGQTLTLSATDACRDRLVAFYHWDDRQSLEVAVQIARRVTVNLRKIREWSAREDRLAAFDEFRKRVRASSRRSGD